MDCKRHYDRLIEEGNDPVRDPKILQEYMDRWDGKLFLDKLSLDLTKSVLEIGVGTGRLALRTASLCRRLVGIDLSPKTVERARENLSAYSHVELICDDFMTHEFFELFDVIYSSLTFLHIADKHAAIRRVASLLKRDGLFALSIDKNPAELLNMGTRTVKLYPDDPQTVRQALRQAQMTLCEEYETEAAYLFFARKQ